MNATANPAREYTESTTSGRWLQQFPVRTGRPQGHPMWSHNGAGFIQGYIEIGNSGASNCLAHLVVEQTGAVVDSVIIHDGAYIFRNIAPGNYAVVILDTLGRFRAKVIHPVVP